MMLSQRLLRSCHPASSCTSRCVGHWPELQHNSCRAVLMISFAQLNRKRGVAPSLGMINPLPLETIKSCALSPFQQGSPLSDIPFSPLLIAPPSPDPALQLFRGLPEFVDAALHNWQAVKGQHSRADQHGWTLRRRGPRASPVSRLEDRGGLL